jgi:hypothetical protein
MWQAIYPHARLTATLRVLSIKRPYEDFKFLTQTSPQEVGKRRGVQFTQC